MVGRSRADRQGARDTAIAGRSAVEVLPLPVTEVVYSGARTEGLVAVTKGDGLCVGVSKYDDRGLAPLPDATTTAQESSRRSTRSTSAD